MAPSFPAVSPLPTRTSISPSTATTSMWLTASTIASRIAESAPSKARTRAGTAAGSDSRPSPWTAACRTAESASPSSSISPGVALPTRTSAAARAPASRASGRGSRSRRRKSGAASAARSRPSARAAAARTPASGSAVRSRSGPTTSGPPRLPRTPIAADRTSSSGSVKPVERDRHRLGGTEVAERLERGGPERRCGVAPSCLDELGRQIATRGVADGAHDRRPDLERRMQQQLREQLAGAGAGELDQRLHRLGEPFGALDHPDQRRRHAQALEADGGADPDLGIGVVERHEQRPLGARADLLERLDAPHAHPPGRIAERADQAVDHLGVVELPERAGDARADERRRIREQVVEEVGDRAAVAEAAERRGALGPHLVLEVAEAAHEHREGALGADLAQHVGGPGARRMAAGLLEKGDQRIDHQSAVAGENVRDARREPDLGGLERLDQRLHRARVGNAGERAEGDLAHVAVFDPGGLHGLEQRRHRLGVADPPQQLGREGALPPLARGPQPLDVAVHQAEAVVDVEQPLRALGGAAGLLLEHGLERLEVEERPDAVNAPGRAGRARAWPARRRAVGTGLSAGQGGARGD